MLASPTQTAFERARIAYTARDYGAAREAALQAAAGGNPEAMVLAGLLLERGQGGATDAAAARTWYEKAAAQGQPDAMMALARLAAQSRGGLAPADARTWLRRAQGEGVPGAGLALGRMLAEGVGGPPDPAGARAAFEAEAAKGGREAIRDLAMFNLQQGGDPAAARAELERAASMGDADAAFEAGVLYADSPDATDADLARAAALFKQAADIGHAAGATLYAHALYQGAGVAQDRAGAVDWYRRGAERGDAEGAFYYAVMLFAGAGVPADAEESYYWVLRSALADPAPLTGYGAQRDALRAQIENALDRADRAAVAARAERDAASASP